MRVAYLSPLRNSNPLVSPLVSTQYNIQYLRPSSRTVRPLHTPSVRPLPTLRPPEKRDDQVHLALPAIEILVSINIVVINQPLLGRGRCLLLLLLLDGRCVVGACEQGGGG